MTAPVTTPDMSPQSAADVAAQAEADQPHFEKLATDAAALRGDDYDGQLTAALLLKLEPLLRRPTPAKYVKHTPPTEGKPYPSTGIASPQVQVDHMNAVLGTPHWRILNHYEDDGTLCKVVVIVGNKLATATLDPAGELVPGDAEVLAERNGWGAVKRGNTKGDLLKGSETNALKRALARFGPGADVYRLDFEDENVGGTGPGYQPQPSNRGVGRGGKKATEGQVKLINTRASQAGLAGADLANVVLVALGHPGRQFASPQQAADYATRAIQAIPIADVDAVLEAIKAGPITLTDSQGQVVPAILPPAEAAPAPAPAAPAAAAPPAPVPAARPAVTAANPSAATAALAAAVNEAMSPAAAAMEVPAESDLSQVLDGGQPQMPTGYAAPQLPADTLNAAVDLGPLG